MERRSQNIYLRKCPNSFLLPAGPVGEKGILESVDKIKLPRASRKTPVEVHG